MRAIAFAVLAFLFFGVVAGVAYQVGFNVAGAAAVGAGAASAPPAAYPYYWPGAFFFPFGFLFPLLFLFLIFGLASAAFGRHRSGGGHDMHWGGPRMWDEWHRELHERDKAGAEKAER